MQDSRKEIIAWSLYDWANSAFATTVMAGFFPIFFSSYWSTANSAQVSTFYLGLANSLEAVLVAILAPILGSIADKGSFKKRFLIFFTFLGCVMTSGLWFVQAGMWQLAVIFYILATVGFSGSLIFYDALLPAVASPKKVDFVSSLGYSMGYIGGGLLFLVNVLMYLNPSWFGFADEVAAVRAAFVSVAIWWAVFSIEAVRHHLQGDQGPEGRRNLPPRLLVLYRRGRYDHPHGGRLRHSHRVSRILTYRRIVDHSVRRIPLGNRLQ